MPALRQAGCSEATARRNRAWGQGAADPQAQASRRARRSLLALPHPALAPSSRSPWRSRSRPRSEAQKPAYVRTRSSSRQPQRVLSAQADAHRERGVVADVVEIRARADRTPRAARSRSGRTRDPESAHCPAGAEGGATPLPRAERGQSIHGGAPCSRCRWSAPHGSGSAFKQVFENGFVELNILRDLRRGGGPGRPQGEAPLVQGRSPRHVDEIAATPTATPPAASTVS